MKEKIHIKVYLIVLLLINVQLVYSTNTRFDFKSNLVFQLKKKQDSILYKSYKIADSLHKSKNYSSALRQAFKVLDKATEENNSELISNTNYLIGKIWYSTESYEKAVSYFKLSLDGFSKAIKDNSSITDDLETRKILLDDYRYVDNSYKIGKSYQKLFELLVSKEQSENHLLSRNDSIKKINIKIVHYTTIIE